MQPVVRCDERQPHQTDREDRWLLGLRTEEKIEARARASLYRSVAEKLSENNVRVYSFIEFSILNDYSRSERTYPRGVVLNGELMFEINSIDYAGGGHQNAPELPSQIFGRRVRRDLDAVVFNTTELEIVGITLT
jgi:hypothetical protein